MLRFKYLIFCSSKICSESHVSALKDKSKTTSLSKFEIARGNEEIVLWESVKETNQERGWSVVKIDSSRLLCARESSFSEGMLVKESISPDVTWLFERFIEKSEEKEGGEIIHEKSCISFPERDSASIHGIWFKILNTDPVSLLLSSVNWLIWVSPVNELGNDEIWLLLKVRSYKLTRFPIFIGRLVSLLLLA